MQRFEFRGPRFSVDFPVQYTVQKTRLEGRCTEISKEGMKLELEKLLESNSSGRVSLTHQGHTLEFSVRVVHVGTKNCGLAFIYSSEAEQVAVAHLVDSISAPANRRRPVLVRSL